MARKVGALNEPPPAALVVDGEKIAIPTSGELVFGRDYQRVNVCVPDKRVSRRHASFYMAEGRYCVRDLDSRNGTYVNGRRIDAETPLNSLDEIRIVSAVMVFVHGAAPRPAQPAVSAAGDGHCLAGRLDAMPLPELVQFLSSVGKTGVLMLSELPRGPDARISLVKGEIVQVSFGSQINEEAFFALLRQPTGRFRFEPSSPVTPPSPVRMDTISLLLEAAKRMDEAEAPSHQAGA